MTEAVKALYEEWLKNAKGEPELYQDLSKMASDEALVNDAFYRELSFGTAGLRGVLGAGTNRMNIFVVARATRGLANYLLKSGAKNPSVALSYDSRINSDVFAKTAAGVLAAAGIKAYIYPQLMPVPCLSFATRYLHATAGIMVTASHNPSKYNGYKVYGSDGCQLGEAAADAVLAEINKLGYFGDAPVMPFEEGLKSGAIEYISDEVYDAFVAAVKTQSLASDARIDKNVAIVYSPLNGTGLKPVTRVLSEMGYTNITVVKEQEHPDGHFPTCPYPNPEIQQAMALGMEYAAKQNADLLMATDPDCDRIGIAVKSADGTYKLLTGNQVGVLLTDYVCARRQALGTLPKDAVIVKSVVSTGLADKVAEGYGVKTINVLTGFKNIGDQIARLEQAGEVDKFLLGFEESYGYLSGTHARDKDGVVAALLICEMFAYYKTAGKSLLDRLAEIYAQYGFCLNRVYSYEFEGQAGFTHMQELMSGFHAYSADSVCGKAIARIDDFKKGVPGIPKADMILFNWTDGNSLIIRPSGTEPKIKTYVTLYAPTEAAAEEQCGKLKEEIDKIIC